MKYPAVLAAVFTATAFAAHAQNVPKADPPKAPTDIRIAGEVSPSRVNADMEDTAKKQQDSGKPAALGRKFYFFFAANPTEFAALAKYTVFLIAVWTQKAEELPLKRVYIRANGQDTPVTKVSGSRSEVDSKFLASKMFGPHREDGIYLVPTGMMLRDGQILIDFAANITGYDMLQLPSNVATDNAKKNSMYNSPDPAPNAKPNLKTLQGFIQRKLPGFPVPNALP